MAIRSHQIAVMVALVSGASINPSYAQDGFETGLPPPPDVNQINQQGIYYLSVVINGQESQKVIPATFKGDQIMVTSADLEQAGVPAGHLAPGKINLSQQKEIKTSFDATHQRLNLMLLPDWLPRQSISMGKARENSYTAMSSKGALLNYDIYGVNTDAGSTQVSLWHELRLFGDSGSFSTTGATAKQFFGDDNASQGYTRYDSQFLFTDEKRLITTTVGDVISDAVSWSSSVRMGGISIGRDFTLRPDLVTYPLPAFSGQAAVPSSVDVFVNGYRTGGSSTLQPGPFTVTNLPLINGAGDAVVVTTDALGRQVSTTLPFYVSSELLKAGLSDSAGTLGALRRNYGIDNFDYGPGAASGSWRYGVTDYWTLETHSEAAERLASGGVGSLVRLGYYGVINGAVTQSQMRRDDGRQYDWGYQYNTNRFTFATQHTRRDRGFGSLANYDQPANRTPDNPPLVSLSKSLDQYSLSLNLSDYGNLGAAWIDVQSFNSDRTRLLNLTWSRGFFAGSSVYVSGSYDPDQSGWALGASLQIPFGSLSNVSFSGEHAPGSGDTQRLNVTHSMSSDGGFSWNLALVNQSQGTAYQQGTLGWRNSQLDLQGGVYGEHSQMTRWGEARGALVMMDRHLLFANQINDAFMVINTDGVGGIPVNYENQTMGTTNNDGYLLVSGVSAYYPAQYALNTLTLPANTQVDDISRQVALRRHSGYMLQFNIKQGRMANLILEDGKGKPIPVGSQVMRAGLASALVGYDGLVYLEDLQPQNLLHVIAPDGSQCQATFNLALLEDGKLHTFGPLACPLQGKP